MLWLLSFAILMLGVSLFLQKYANMKTKGWKALFTNKIWLFAVVLAFLHFLVYMYVLGFERLAIVQPLMSLSIVVAMICSVMFLKEKMPKTDIIGFLLILLGLFFIGGAIIL